MSFKNYEEWLAAEAEFLGALDDEQIRGLYVAAKEGNADAAKTLAGIAIANFGPPVRAMTAHEMKVDRAFEILFWLRKHQLKRHCERGANPFATPGKSSASPRAFAAPHQVPHLHGMTKL